MGPFFGFALVPEQHGCPLAGIGAGDMAADADGARIRVAGRVFDGAGEAVPDALVEIWQADAGGRYRDGGRRPAGAAGRRPFTGFGRVGTADGGRYAFDTVKPGCVDGRQAPHLNVTLFMRGLLLHVFTRIYFSDEADANARDPVLQSVPADRRATLIARRREAPPGLAYGFDIHMQGERETVFFTAQGSGGAPPA